MGIGGDADGAGFRDLQHGPILPVLASADPDVVVGEHQIAIAVLKLDLGVAALDNRRLSHCQVANALVELRKDGADQPAKQRKQDQWLVQAHRASTRVWVKLSGLLVYGIP